MALLHTLECASLEDLLEIKGLLYEHLSCNELLEEIKTRDLPYIATDYFIAQKYYRSQTGSRMASLESAKEHFERFFEWTERYGLSSQTFVCRASRDPAAMRLQKIGRLSRIRELRDELSVRPSDRDEELLRQYWLKWVQIREMIAIDEYAMLEREASLVGSVETGGSGNGRPAANTPHTRAFLPFVLTREAARSTVFRPSHNLPTMTIDEFLALEQRRGNVIHGAGRHISNEHPENDVHLDAQIEKLRERDERWDWITKGSGNRYNRS